MSEPEFLRLVLVFQFILLPLLNFLHRWYVSWANMRITLAQVSDNQDERDEPEGEEEQVGFRS